MIGRITRNYFWGALRERNIFRVNRANRRYQAVPTPADGFDISGCLRIVSQHFAQLPHGGIQAVFENNKRILRPEALMQLGAANDFAGPFRQCNQHPERLLLHPYAAPIPAQLARPPIQLKWPKPIARREDRRGHRETTRNGTRHKTQSFVG